METIENGNLIGSINGTIIGGIELVTGKKGFAVYTNGVDQYVNFVYQSDTCLGFFTLCTRGWVSVFWLQEGSSNHNYAHVMDIRKNHYKGMKITWNRGDVIKAVFRNYSTLWCLSGKAPTGRKWIHVVVTWQPCNGAKLYFDGGLVKRHTLLSKSYSPKSEVPRFVLGANYVYNKQFKGAVDELRKWDTVMSDQEVLTLYKADAGLN